MGQVYRVWTLADGREAMPAQPLPREKVFFMNTTDSRQAVTNRGIIMPQTEYPDNSDSSGASHLVPLHDWVSPSSLEKNLVHVTTVNLIPGHVTSHQQNQMQMRTLNFIKNVPGKTVKADYKWALSF